MIYSIPNYETPLTHWGRVTHICVSKLTIIVSWSAPSHYLNQYSNIVNSKLKNQLQWNLKQNSHIFIQENVFEKVVCEMATILSRPKYVTKPLILAWCQAIICTRTHSLSCRPQATNFSGIRIKCAHFQLRKCIRNCTVRFVYNRVNCPLIHHQEKGCKGDRNSRRTDLCSWQKIRWGWGKMGWWSLEDIKYDAHWQGLTLQVLLDRQQREKASNRQGDLCHIVSVYAPTVKEKQICWKYGDPFTNMV